MHSDKPNIPSEGLRKELDFFKTIVQSIPAVVFINEVESPGDEQSCHIIWMNQRGFDFTGYSKEEISNMGYGFFRKIIHHDDLGVVASTIQTVCSFGPHLVMIAMFRIKAKGRNDYSWIYSPYVVLDTFEKGFPKRILCAAFEITETMQSENKLVMILKEINRLKHELKQCNFTRREKEILPNWSRWRSRVWSIDFKHEIVWERQVTLIKEPCQYFKFIKTTSDLVPMRYCGPQRPRPEET